MNRDDVRQLLRDARALARYHRKWLIGFLVVLVITPLFPVDPLVGLPALIGYFSIFGVTGGVLIGAIVPFIAYKLHNYVERRFKLDDAALKRAAPIATGRPSTTQSSPAAAAMRCVSRSQAR